MKILLTLFVLFFSSSVVAEEKNSLFGIKLLWDSYPDKSLKYFDVNLDKDSINSIDNIDKLKRIKKYIEKNEFCEKIDPIIPNKDYDTYEACLTITSKKIYKIRATGLTPYNLCWKRWAEYEEYFRDTYSNFWGTENVMPLDSDLEKGTVDPNGSYPYRFIFTNTRQLKYDHAVDRIYIDLHCDNVPSIIEIYALKNSNTNELFPRYEIIEKEEKQVLINLIDNKIVNLELNEIIIDKSGL